MSSNKRQIIKIDKTGNIKYDNISNINEIYKKCGYRKINDFDKITTWQKNIDNKTINIELWGRIKGKNNIKNTYIFPQSFNTIIYGNCALINIENNQLFDLTEKLWNKMYIVEETPTSPIENIDIISVNNNENSEDTTDIEDNDEILIDDNDDSYENSELQKDSYIYSSEED